MKFRRIPRAFRRSRSFEHPSQKKRQRNIVVPILSYYSTYTQQELIEIKFGFLSQDRRTNIESENNNNTAKMEIFGFVFNDAMLGRLCLSHCLTCILNQVVQY